MSKNSLSSDTPVPAEKTPENTTSLIYVGPSLGGGKLTRFTVYQGGKPKHMEQIFSECPEVEKLFVPVDKLAPTLDKIAITGTPFHTWFNRVVEYQQKGGNQ